MPRMPGGPHPDRTRNQEWTSERQERDARMENVATRARQAAERQRDAVDREISAAANSVAITKVVVTGRMSVVHPDYGRVSLEGGCTLEAEVPEGTDPNAVAELLSLKVAAVNSRTISAQMPMVPPQFRSDVPWIQLG